MKRMIFGFAGISAGVLVAVGCGSDPVTTTTTTTTVQDGSVLGSDGNTIVAKPDARVTILPGADAQAGLDAQGGADAKVPVTEVDGGVVPACYGPPQQVSSAQVVQALQSTSALDYHAALAKSTGCLAQDATAFQTAFNTKLNAAQGDPTKIFQIQNDLDGLASVSAPCKVCLSAEFASTNPNGPNAKWGTSGTHFLSDRTLDQSGPSNPLGVNNFGCGEVSGAVTTVQARALYRATACATFHCGQSCGTQEVQLACFKYALEEGACKPFKAAADAAAPAYAPVQASCSTVAGVVTAFCGS